MMNERIPIYAHDDASLPSDWADVARNDYGDVWMRNEVAVRKNDQVFVVSREFVEDYGYGAVFGLLRTKPWAQRADDELYRFQPGYRIRSWIRERSATLRRAIADRIYPERDYDW